MSIDMPAGPSEVLVIADKYANPVHIAADLLSQVTFCVYFSSNNSLIVTEAVSLYDHIKWLFLLATISYIKLTRCQC